MTPAFGGRKWLLAMGALAVAVGTLLRAGSEPETHPDYANLGKAPDFTLLGETGGDVTLSDLHGKVVLVNFMFTRCYDLCPTLTSKLADVQEAIAPSLAEDVYIVSISVDPEYDRPEVLREFAENMDYDPRNWSFLTGEPDEVRKVAGSYGVVMAKQARDLVDHNLLTTIVDRSGIMRVQYLGARFDTEEMIADIRNLAG